jgi:radical SAM/Cys-rich protein
VSLEDRPLAAAAEQLRVLEALPLDRGDFDAAVGRRLHTGDVGIFQINVGRLCNMTCRHCHVDAGPHRVTENMSRATMEQALALLDQLPAHTVDITGGAPELNPHFRWLVEQCAARGKHILDRNNLTVLLLARNEDLPSFLAEHGVEVVCSLPHWRRPNTDRQRGEGTYDRSIEALRRLNAVGYGQGDPRRRLTLVHNPAGAFLPTGQAGMEREWRAGLQREHGVSFDRLIALNNMPISRYLEWLLSTGNLQPYMELLTASFNPAAVGGLMCLDTLSVGWDGTLYDCDFNQMLELPAQGRLHVSTATPADLVGRRIVTRRHCFGCTAGAGSSCGGATT